MDRLACPHCGADRPQEAAFCTSCGQALPSLASQSPRLIEKTGIAVTSLGRGLQSEELRKETKKAAGALLAVAILQIVVGCALVALLPPSPEKKVLFAFVVGVGFLFFLLFLWARRNPLPAAITGLVLFLTVHLLDAVADPTALGRGIIMKVIVIAVLAKAISAGIRHRKLTEATVSTSS